VRTVRDEAAAEDLLQEVLLRVWKSAGQWREEGSLQAWLYRIATNLALNAAEWRNIKREWED
jgi:RNA polymerase sigma-70 factor (ECF subfamily)